MKIRTNKHAGFTLVEIMIVVAIIGLLAAIAIPNFVKARSTSQMNACINNLRQIDSAKQQILLEKGDAAPLDQAAVTPYLGRGAAGEFPNCPKTQANTYAIGTATQLPTCSNTTPEYPHVLPTTAAPPAG
jgi:prepilin-type N-terminal cleavage/methylation domain-containing protein